MKARGRQSHVARAHAIAGVPASEIWPAIASHLKRHLWCSAQSTRRIPVGGETYGLRPSQHNRPGRAPRRL